MLENNTAITHTRLNKKKKDYSCFYFLSTSHFFLTCVHNTVILSCLCCFMLSLPVMTPLIHHPLCSVSSVFFSYSSCAINILPKCYCHSSNPLLVRKTQKRCRRFQPGLALKTSKRKQSTPLEHLYSYYSIFMWPFHDSVCTIKETKNSTMLDPKCLSCVSGHSHFMFVLVIQRSSRVCTLFSKDMGQIRRRVRCGYIVDGAFAW